MLPFFIGLVIGGIVGGLIVLLIINDFDFIDEDEE